MKLRIVLHERNTLALDGVRDQHGGLSLGGGGLRKCTLKGSDIVTVYFDHVPAEAVPLVRQRSLIENILHEPVELNPVAVDDRHDVIQLVKTAEHGGLPDLPLLDFSIAQHHVGPRWALIEARAQTHSDTQG